MKKPVLMIYMVLPIIGLLASCTKNDSNKPDYVSANIGNINWSANNISAGSDTTGYSAIEADNDDGSLFYISFPSGAEGNYCVSNNDDCSIEYIDSQGNSYSIQGGSMSINSSLFSGINGSFQGVAINDANCNDQIDISGGSFNVN